MTNKTVNIVSLGCSKNLVDTERLMRMLADRGIKVTFESDESAYAVVINTCGFIGDAKEESINTILHWVQKKMNREVKEIIVMGCLSQRYGEELRKEIPEVDCWFGKTNWNEVAHHLTGALDKPGIERVLTTPPHQAYLKIAEGCNRFCAFCAIPLITGRYKSRPIDEICREVKYLVSKGVKEFNVIAQDTSYYGVDLSGKPMLAELIDAISDIEGVEWIRLHYLYPHQFPYDVLDVMARKSNVCRYIDMALQHISDNVLSNMRRHIDKEETVRLLETIRSKVPGIHIRTTLMVGFPGEGEKEFEELMEFVKEQRFERMGAFAYCEEDDTYAALNYTDSIPQEVKQKRLDALMKLQEEISNDLQNDKIGKVFRVIVDSESDDYYIGRTEFDSPEVDPEVLIEKNRRLVPGEFYNVRVTEAYPFELIARPID